MTITTGIVETVIRIKDETAKGLAAVRASFARLKSDSNGGQVAIRGLSAAAGAAFGSLSASAWRMSQDYESALAAIARGTGATGAELDALHRVVHPRRRPEPRRRRCHAPTQKNRTE